MKISSPFDLVGSTPLVNIGTINNAVLWAKLEGTNPTGSLKDRTAAALVKSGVEQYGNEKMFLDASSGSFACALAYFCRLHKAPCTLVVNSKISGDNLAFLTTQGAEIIYHGNVTGESRAHCLELLDKDPSRWIFTDQLTNPLAPQVHHDSTASEILGDCLDVAAIVASKGSGATLLGIARYMSVHKPSVQIYGSVGLPGDEKKIAGTYVEGADFVSPFINELSTLGIYQSDVRVRYKSAMERCVELPVLVGPQGGGVYEAARQVIFEHDISGNVVLVMGDSMLKNVSRFTPQ